MAFHAFLLFTIKRLPIFADILNIENNNSCTVNIGRENQNMINGVSTRVQSEMVKAERAKKSSEAAGEAVKAEKSKATDTDTIEISYKKPDKLTSDQLQEISNQRIASFNKMLESMLGKQASQFNKANFQNLNISSADQLAAQKAIGEGGEWSPEAVAGRILDMAKALSGGDASKISVLKEAVEKGFSAATKSWGGKLPSITDDTHDRVMKGFDEWEKSAKGTSSTEE